MPADGAAHGPRRRALPRSPPASCSPPGGITVAMLGTRHAIQSQLAVIARHVPDIVHVAVRVTDKDEAGALEPRLVDELDLAGIGAVHGDRAARLALRRQPGRRGERGGADRRRRAGRGQPPRTRHRAGERLRARPAHRAWSTTRTRSTSTTSPCCRQHADRYVVARHLRHASSEAAWTGDHGRPPAISADLGLLLAGARPGREQQADTLVVELLSAHTPDTRLAQTIAETAVRLRLGVRVTA